MKKIELNNRHKNKYGNLKTILFIWSFKRKILPEGRLKNTEQEYVSMEECNNGELNTGKIMLQW